MVYFMKSKSTMESPGEIVARFRMQRGLTLRKLGEAAGIPHSYVSSIEQDHRSPGPKVGLRLAEALAMRKPDKDNFLLAVAEAGKKDRTTQRMRDIPRGLLLALAETLSQHLGKKTVRSCRMAVSGEIGRGATPDFIIEFTDNSRVGVELKIIHAKA